MKTFIIQTSRLWNGWVASVTCRRKFSSIGLHMALPSEEEMIFSPLYWYKWKRDKIAQISVS